MSVSIVIPFEGDQIAAARAVFNRLDEFAGQEIGGAKLTWERPEKFGIRLTAGSYFDGMLRVGKNRVTVEAELSLLAKPFAGKIKKEISGKIRKFLTDGGVNVIRPVRRRK